MFRLDDAIAAPITALGGAVAGVRVSGEGAWEIVRGVFPSLPESPEPRRALYGRFAHGDDGLCLPFGAGGSYTGEESAELFVHGSPASVRLLMTDLLRAGARMAEPGEFTQRAFLNGRLDLSQAEGVRAAVEAESESALRAADRQLGGATRLAVSGLTARIERVLGEIEARVDFSEELGELDFPATLDALHRVRGDLAGLRQGARATRLAREGARIAILGKPNAGKSSLLNALVRRERALVTPYPGTTRDTIEEAVEVGGLRLVLIDTAGLRETDDPVEALGVARSREEGAGADVVWYVYDASEPFENEAPDDALIVANKADLAAPTDGLPVSATERTGLDRLLEATLQRLAFAPPRIPISDRHAEALAEADDALAGAESALRPDLPPDLSVTLLREALWCLGTITGESADEGLLERIFSGFCVGK